MEDVAFGDWPGQPVDPNTGGNPWLPAYGLHRPADLMREDFDGSPDADYFLPSNGCGGTAYAYLETILEETSDDLLSEDEEDSRESPAGWLATDSESGSVICIDAAEDCDSDRELACPPKRRRHDVFLTIPTEDDEKSLSRSSSLLQFETLEKQCQESSSPSVFSQFSFDSLEAHHRLKSNVSPDSLNSPASEDEGDFGKVKGKFSSRSDSGDSDTTIENSRSLDNLKTWRSFESLSLENSSRGISGKKDDKVSAENLSEDSGYSDHLTKSSGNLEKRMRGPEDFAENRRKVACLGGFGAYDGDVFQTFTGNFGVSYHDLSAFDKLEPPPPPPAWRSSPLIDAFLRKKLAAVGDGVAAAAAAPPPASRRRAAPEIAAECPCVFPTRSSSAPDLATGRRSPTASAAAARSAPEDLHLVGAEPAFTSVAAQDLDIADLGGDGDMASYRREGSYEQAMADRVDLSDDETSLRYRKRLPRTPIVEFDRRVLKAISEQSIQSLGASNRSLNASAVADPEPRPRRLNSAAASVPNLDRIGPAALDEDRRRSVQEVDRVGRAADDHPPDLERLRAKSPEVVLRKGSIIKSSTSNSGMSDDGERTLRNSVKSFTGSTGSKGVHFSPVVSEVNWRDDASVSTATPERESSYSLRSSSSSPEPEKPPQMVKPKPRFGTPARRTVSQPDLSDTDSCLREFNTNLKEFIKLDVSKSQPDIGGNLKRKGSRLVKRTDDGSTVSAYVDRDGVQYRHTLLDSSFAFLSSAAAAASSGSPHSSYRQLGGGGAAAGGGGSRPPAAGAATMQTGQQPQQQQRQKDGRGKIGGFLQRLASFRFSGRRDKDKKKKAAAASPGAAATANQPRVATKDDYIYIPLKGPPTSAAAAGKPPLPRQPPPRVVHASAKPQARRRPAADDGGAAIDPRRPPAAARAAAAMEPPPGLIETDLDTEVTVITGSAAAAKTRSMLSLVPEQGERRHRPHKSMEFLLDKQNLKVVEPPENELQKGERVMSEHQLRVQRSLQKLTVPEWYKSSAVPREGFLLKKNSPRETRWTGTGSKTTSLSSLGSTAQSPVALSPTPSGQPFVRWSTSKLNSTASSPCQSTRSSFNARQGASPAGSARSSFSYRQPYLGWRSQERLTRPRTPAERLASSILDGRREEDADGKDAGAASPEIQTSIKEVTSAIVHYVSGRRPDALDGYSRSPGSSPRGSQKLCWVESSFVGTRPPDSPQTPAGLAGDDDDDDDDAAAAPRMRLDLQPHNDAAHLRAGEPQARPSPGSTTLEDVLDSLLGLPASGRAASPCLQAETASVSGSPPPPPPADGSPRRGSEEAEEGAAAAGGRPAPPPGALRCRYARCGRSAAPATPEAAAFKNCHNCAYTYCSRACRRAHWEKHRKTCLFSRVGSLCRQVIAAAKEQKDSLLHLSKIARRGYISHGLGAVKCFFPAPEAAERFLSEGTAHLGELTYVRWQDLLPSEMGGRLYAELVRMCKAYNPDTRLVLYVSVCVVSETPATGAVKWERQLVSRCAKLRLANEPPARDENLETLVLTCAPLGAGADAARLRRLAVDSCQDRLRERGVSLRRQHPLVFRQLGAFRDDPGVRLNAITLYPQDANTGKSFMCIIMLESDGEGVKKVEKAGVKVRTVDLLGGR